MTDYNVLEIKRHNIKSIIDCLRFKDSSTKRQMAAETGLSFATVSNMCNLLLKANTIDELEETAEVSVGRSPKNIGLRVDSNSIVGIDLHHGGSVIINLYNLRCELTRATSFCYDVSINIAEFVEQLSRAYFEFIGGERAEIIGVGVAVPGIFDIHTENIVASEIEIFEEQPLKKLLIEALKTNVYIENESNLCAVELSRSEKVQNVIYIYLGEGVGVGILSGGKAIVGSNGYASEICHMPLGRLNQPCHLCKSDRCLQTDLSYHGFAAKFFDIEGAHNNLDGWREYLRSVAQASPKALAVAEENAEILGEAISVLTNLFDPELVAVGGIPRSLFDVMLPVIRQTNSRRRVVSTAPAPLYLYDGDCDATVIRGAAQMVYSRWFPVY